MPSSDVIVVDTRGYRKLASEAMVFVRPTLSPLSPLTPRSQEAGSGVVSPTNAESKSARGHRLANQLPLGTIAMPSLASVVDGLPPPSPVRGRPGRVHGLTSLSSPRFQSQGPDESGSHSVAGVAPSSPPRVFGVDDRSETVNQFISRLAKPKLESTLSGAPIPDALTHAGLKRATAMDMRTAINGTIAKLKEGTDADREAFSEYCKSIVKERNMPLKASRGLDTDRWLMRHGVTVEKRKEKIHRRWAAGIQQDGEALTRQTDYYHQRRATLAEEEEEASKPKEFASLSDVASTPYMSLLPHKERVKIVRARRQYNMTQHVMGAFGSASPRSAKTDSGHEGRGKNIAESLSGSMSATFSSQPRTFIPTPPPNAAMMKLMAKDRAKREAIRKVIEDSDISEDFSQRMSTRRPQQYTREGAGISEGVADAPDVAIGVTIEGNDTDGEPMPLPNPPALLGDHLVTHRPHSGGAVNSQSYSARRPAVRHDPRTIGINTKKLDWATDTEHQWNHMLGSPTAASKLEAERNRLLFAKHLKKNAAESQLDVSTTPKVGRPPAGTRKDNPASSRKKEQVRQLEEDLLLSSSAPPLLQGGPTDSINLRRWVTTIATATVTMKLISAVVRGREERVVLGEEAEAQRKAQALAMSAESPVAEDSD